MKFKRFVYSLLLCLLILVLVADLGLWFLVPEAEAVTSTADTPFPGGFSQRGERSEGMTPPEGTTFTPGEGFPEGMTFTPGEGFPEGMTFTTDPEGGEGTDGSSRRRRRTEEGETPAAEAVETASAEETDATEPTVFDAVKAWLSSLRETLSGALVTYLPSAALSTLMEVKRYVAPYRLYILLGAAVATVLCILRLILLNRKIRQRQEALESEGGSHRRVALWPAFGLLLLSLGLVVFLFPGNETEEVEEGAVTNSRVLSGTVEAAPLTSLIQSAGSLAEQEAVTLTIPGSVTVSSVCVRNGDTVTASQIVALADRTGLMQAISDLHEALSDIDSQLQTAHDAKRDTVLSAPVAGTVKVVYAQAGQQVADVMREHGSLMLLSLDGRMAVQVPAADGLTIGSGATVTLADGTALAGEVTFLEEGVATVTVTDRGYAIGEQVSVKTAAGTLLGSGPLYVHKSLDIVGYLGTVVRIYKPEGSAVTSGMAVIGLSGTADLGDYQALLQQRSEYEAELQTLFELYETGYIHAPCDGVIEGLSDDLPYQSLADMAAGLTVRQLASPADADPTEYVHYVGQVLENNGGLLSLKVSSGPVTVSSYASLPSLPSSTMTGTYTIPGSVPIYLLSGGWGSIPAAQILVGDRILFAFDSNGALVWVIVAHTSSSVTPSPVPEPTPTPTPVPTRDPSASADPDESPSPSGSPGSGHGRGGGGIRFSFSGGSGANGAQKAAYTIAETELCTVTPQERMLLTVPVDELDVLSLTLGQEADLYLDALPARGFTATVTEINEEGENSGGDTKYSVTLALVREPQLYPGMNGTVCFPRSEGDTTPTIPLAALQEEGNRVFVYTAYNEETDELLSPVEVQTGLSDGTDVQILSGLSVGDTYYYRYADAISYVTD